MIYYMRGIDKPYIMSIDIEYDKEKIIQIGSITLKKIGKYLYQPCRSINIYIKRKDLSQFIQDYTNITKEFLNTYGCDIKEAQEKWKEYMSYFTYDNVLIISHGIYQDSIIMKNNGFNIDGYEHWCTYNQSKWTFERENNLTLSDIVKEGGLLPISEHNAYADALSTLNIFSLLLKLEGDS